MKRGQLPIEFLVTLVIRVLAVVAVFVILYMLISALLSSGKTPEIKDFERLLNEFEELREVPYMGQDLEVPVVATSNMRVFVYGDKSATRPSVCSGLPCICLYEGERETCKVFKDLKVSCDDTCGDVECLRTGSAQGGSGRMRLVRGCNDVSILA